MFQVIFVLPLLKRKVNKTMTEHTPEPWIFDNSLEHYPRDVVRHNNGLIVAVILDETDPKPAIRSANISLILAAPAMLKALRKVTALAMESEQYEMYLACSDIVDDALDVIALAEGRKDHDQA